MPESSNAAADPGSDAGSPQPGAADLGLDDIERDLDLVEDAFRALDDDRIDDAEAFVDRLTGSLGRAAGFEKAVEGSPLG